jgi:hypothetical protein
LPLLSSVSAYKPQLKTEVQYVHISTYVLTTSIINIIQVLGYIVGTVFVFGIHPIPTPTPTNSQFPFPISLLLISLSTWSWAFSMSQIKNQNFETRYFPISLTAKDTCIEDCSRFLYLRSEDLKSNLLASYAYAYLQNQ